MLLLIIDVHWLNWTNYCNVILNWKFICVCAWTVILCIALWQKWKRLILHKTFELNFLYWSVCIITATSHCIELKCNLQVLCELVFLQQFVWTKYLLQLSSNLSYIEYNSTERFIILHILRRSCCPSLLPYCSFLRFVFWSILSIYWFGFRVFLFILLFLAFSFWFLCLHVPFSLSFCFLCFPYLLTSFAFPSLVMSLTSFGAVDDVMKISDK